MKAHDKRGFTIVELSLASAFLGILLITIALLVTHVITIYQKGMTIKSVNTIGEDLIDNFTRSISASVQPDEVKIDVMYKEQTATVKIARANKEFSAPSRGIFCTGKYTYLWNTGYILDDENQTYTKPGGDSLKDQRMKVTYPKEDGSGGKETIDDFRLLQVNDLGRALCNGLSSNQLVSFNLDEKPTELLEKSEDNLALYDLTIFEPKYHNETRHSFYSGTFILATIRGGVNIMDIGNFCTDQPDNLNTDFAYCAINKFNFATRATGIGDATK
ncbi:hypothetical protein IJH02_00605 [Candidatus Saccharibacteria bacterium]|nr:hypothetical protein [Candidatus Saccharibacteria bacterium]